MPTLKFSLGEAADSGFTFCLLSPVPMKMDYELQTIIINAIIWKIKVKII